MPKNTSARGYTNAILVLNMKRFVAQEDQERFETIRGSQPFADVVRSVWPEQAKSQNTFLTIHEDKRRRSPEDAHPDTMLTEEVGFATGIFNTRMLEEYTFPTFYLDKSRITFSEDLRTNFQFRTLFQRVWDRWDIYIRPTYTGFFVIRLTQRYQDHSRPLIDLAQDVLHLQESLDVVSAQRWLAYNRERYLDNPETLTVKERSVMALLDWMGAEEEESGSLLYYPVQWKLAMVIAGQFVQKIAHHLPIPEADPVRLVDPKPTLSIPLHDSYIIHHFDELLARPWMIRRTKKQKSEEGVQIAARVSDLHNSPRLRRALVNLLEGTILQEPPDEENGKPSESHFPEPRWSITDSLIEQNIASWNDEFCVFGNRTAIIIPSRRSRRFEMAVATVPSATLRVPYLRYWGAVERMIEFIMEIHIYAQLLEGVSFDLLTEIVDLVHRLRPQILSGDIQFDDDVAGLITKAADLRKQAALVQSLSHPLMWSRAEYAARKADVLFTRMGVPRTLDYIERNITSINSVVDQVDEWYLADLSEKNNDRAHYLTVIVTAASFLLTILILPSFWADIWQVFPAREIPAMGVFLSLGLFASLLALVLVYGAGVLLLHSIRNWKTIRDLFRRLLEHQRSA